MRRRRVEQTAPAKNSVRFFLTTGNGGQPEDAAASAAPAIACSLTCSRLHLTIIRCCRAHCAFARRPLSAALDTPQHAVERFAVISVCPTAGKLRVYLFVDAAR